MDELQEEQANLAKADFDVGEGEKRITAQGLLVEQLREKGHDTREAEKLLATLHQSLAAWNVHRDEILRRIEGLSSPGRSD